MNRRRGLVVIGALLCACSSGGPTSSDPPSESTGEMIQVKPGVTDTITLGSGTQVIAGNATGRVQIRVVEVSETTEMVLEPTDDDVSVNLIISKTIPSDLLNPVLRIDGVLPDLSGPVTVYAQPDISPSFTLGTASVSTIGTIQYFATSLTSAITLTLKFEGVDENCSDDFRAFRAWEGDSLPLGSRTPVLLLHGWQLDRKTCASFAGFDPTREHLAALTALLNRQEMREMFKAYYAISTTNDHVLSNSRYISHQIASPEFDLSNVIVIGHSMGGLIGRGILNSLPERVTAVVTLGSPHEGTPLAQAAIHDCGLFPPGTEKITCEFIRGLSAYPFARTAGVSDLRDPSSYLDRSNGSRVYSVGGQVSGWPDIHDLQLKLLWLLMAPIFGENSDAVVPTTSSIPTWTNAVGNYPGYDHFELSRGNNYQTSSPIFDDLATLLKLLRTDPKQTAYAVSGSPKHDVFGLDFVGPSDLFVIELDAMGRDFPMGRIRDASGTEPIITDVAVNPNGTIYVISKDGELYRLRSGSTIADLIGGISSEPVVGLDFEPQTGDLYATTGSALLKVDQNSGHSLVVGMLGNGLKSSGDIVFGSNGQLYGTAYHSSLSNKYENILIAINKSSGRATPIGTGLGSELVFGLVYRDRLYGLTTNRFASSGFLIGIDTSTGRATPIRSLTFDAFGASSLWEIYDH